VATAIISLKRRKEPPQPVRTEEAMTIWGGGSDRYGPSLFRSRRSTRSLMAFRWPKTFPLKAYPALKGNAAPIATEGATR